MERPTIDTVRSQIVGIDQPVPLLDGSSRVYVNLDNAASTPVLRPVQERINAFMPWYASVHRGHGFKSQLSTQVYEHARRIVLDFAGAAADDYVAIFCKHTTEAINKLAYRLPLHTGDVVLCSLMEHHSNDLPWRRRAEVQHVGLTPEGALDEDHLDHLLRRYAGRVRLLAISGASNVTGFVNPIYRLARKAHEFGAQILVDAAQLAPHRKIEVGRLDDPAHLDYLAFSGHKMYAPYGSGALIARRDAFQEGDPDQVGGGAIALVTVSDVLWAPLPDKEEAGSPNVVGALALAEALRCLERIGMDAIAGHEAQLTAQTLERLRKIEGLKIYGDCHAECCASRVGVVSFALRGMDHAQVAAILGYEGGIGVRSGCFCAQPYIFSLLGLKREEIAQARAAAARGEQGNMPGLVRISFGCYNTQEEVTAAAEALERIARGETRGRYLPEPDGRYRPEGYQIDWPRYFALI